MTTVYDVARVAGVSTATVSRVMRESSLVQPETRQRVQAVIEALGFVPDATAQGLSRRRKDIIGSTWVVILWSFLIAGGLFVVDLAFSKFFQLIGVLQQ